MSNDPSRYDDTLEEVLILVQSALKTRDIGLKKAYIADLELIVVTLADDMLEPEIRGNPLEE